MRMMIALAVSALVPPVWAQSTDAEDPLVELAPAVGWGDYVWLLPLLLVLAAVAAWWMLRQRNRP